MAPGPGGVALAAASEPLEDDSIDLRRYWHMLLRRKWILVAAVVLALLVGLVMTYRTTPVYQATLLLHIEPQNDRFLEYQEDVELGESRSDKDFYQTQYELLKSRNLASRVIERLGLQTRSAPRQSSDASALAEVSAGLRRLLGGGQDAQSARDTPGNNGASSSNLEGALLSRLTVSPVRGSRLVRLHYASPNPREAAQILNAWAESFINMTLERRYDATVYAERFLEERIKQVRANLEDSEARLVAYAKERQIYDLEDRLGSAKQRLTAFRNALTAAQTEAIQAAAAAGRDDVGQDDDGLATLMMLDSGVIEQLKERKVDLQIAYRDQLNRFTPDFPDVEQLRQQINEVDEQIAQEVELIRTALEQDYRAKRREQAALQTEVDALEQELLALQDRNTDYQTLKRDVETNSQLYDGLLQRMKEVGVVAGITANNISIVDSAQIPRSPFKPSLRSNLMKALMLGLVVGALVIFLVEHIDDTIKTSDDVETRLHAPVLGVIPYASARAYGIEDQEVPLLAAVDPQSPVAEAVRSLRTQLLFATAEGAPKVLHLTSAGPGEGKTTVATSIAIAFAQAGAKVLLIDADLRAPSLHRVFDLPNSVGLTNYLAGSMQPAEIAQPTATTRLFSITSGPLPPNPVELISSAKMGELIALAAERFDYVLLDGPPVIGLADALVLANLARGTVFVADAESTRYGAMEGAVKRLKAAHANIIGAVIDRLGKVGSGYGYGYGYDYQYTYHYGGRETALPEQA
ncbi:GumC family protein [Halochromatium salexigens]|nr:polysaccharide biosynthesis tyrosine autokinase [Halochromatium salexigens]